MKIQLTLHTSHTRVQYISVIFVRHKSILPADL